MTPILAAEVTCDVVQAVLGLAVAVVAAYVTIRSRQMDAKHERCEENGKRCRRAYRRLKDRVVKLESDRDKKALDRRPPRR